MRPPDPSRSRTSAKFVMASALAAAGIGFLLSSEPGHVAANAVPAGVNVRGFAGQGELAYVSGTVWVSPFSTVSVQFSWWSAGSQ
jgi:hypothetical protein